MRTVKQLLQAKLHTVWTVGPEDTVYQALTLMAEKDIGAVLVLKNEKLVGILSERDYARKIILKGKTSKETLVREIMTEKVIHVTLDHTISQCMTLMTERRCRHLPVLEGTKLVGLISIGDVVKDIISEQEFVIKQLESYISN